MKVGVVLVHGILVSDPAWSNEIIPRMEQHVERALEALPATIRPSRVSDVIVVESVYWNDVVAEGQRKLFDILRTSRPPLKFEGGLWNIVKRLVTYAARSVEQMFITDAIADIINYLDTHTKALIHEKMHAAIERLSSQLNVPPEKSPVTFVAHSLGTVITSDYVWDRTKHAGFHDHLIFTNFFTVGSPLALFSLQYGGPEAFRQPVRVEHPDGRWVNIYDKDDPVGMPLRALNSAYAQAVHGDIQVDAGDYLRSHMAYFKNEIVLRMIGKKLALDWLAVNRKLPSPQLRELYAKYDRELVETSA